MSTRSWSVPGVSCGHCKAAIEGGVSALPGVRRVEVDLEARTVEVEGDAPDEAVVAAVDEAGYDVAGPVTG